MRRSESGFTLVELLVSLVVVTEVLLAVLMLIDFTSRLSRVQANVSDMQQSLRVSMQDVTGEIRMAGAGGLPAQAAAPGGAIQVIDNAGATQRIGGGTTPEVLDNTDVLIVRGTFSTPLYHVDPKLSTTFVLNNANPALATAGSVWVRNQTPTLIPQSLAPLIDAVVNRRPEALLLVSPRDARIYSVVELNPDLSDVADPTNIKIAFFIASPGSTNMARYSMLDASGVYNPNLIRCAFLGILEEYRYYVREELSGTILTPKLSRARTYPNVDSPPWNVDGNDVTTMTNWSQDIGDNIMDMQVALGRDSTNGGGSMIQDSNDDGNDDRIFESSDGKDDDWLFNFPGELDTDVIWTNAALHYVRVDILARTDRQDAKYQAPLLNRIENRTYIATSPYNVREERMFRRRLLRSLVNLRNL